MAIYAGASNNTIGGTASGSGNVISGNAGNGVYLSDSGTTGNVVEGDYIGTDSTGSNALPNADGVVIQNGATNNTIGGTTSAARDVISGNDGDGVHIAGGGTSGNVVEGDYIGVTASGSAALGNGASGVAIYAGASYNTIGGTVAGAGDVLSGNAPTASVSPTRGRATTWSRATTSARDSTGSSAVGNGIGVLIQNGASFTTIGGTTAAARNVISGNFDDGIVLTGSGTSQNQIEGCYIGTDASGKSALGNRNDGIVIASGASFSNFIGNGSAGTSHRVQRAEWRRVRRNHHVRQRDRVLHHQRQRGQRRVLGRGFAELRHRLHDRIQPAVGHPGSG